MTWLLNDPKAIEEAFIGTEELSRYRRFVERLGKSKNLEKLWDNLPEDGIAINVFKGMLDQLLYILKFHDEAPADELREMDFYFYAAPRLLTAITGLSEEAIEIGTDELDRARFIYRKCSYNHFVKLDKKHILVALRFKDGE